MDGFEREGWEEEDWFMMFLFEINNSFLLEPVFSNWDKIVRFFSA